VTTVQQIIDKLNEVLVHDPEWTHELFNHRVACNQSMADHLTCQVGRIGPGLYDVGPLGVIEALIGAGSRIARHRDDSVEGDWTVKFSAWDEDQVTQDLTSYSRDPQYLGDGTIDADHVVKVLNELITADRQAVDDIINHFPRCKPDLETATGVKAFPVELDNAWHAGIMGLINAFITPDMVMRNTGDDGLVSSFNVVDDEQRNIYLRESGKYFPTDIQVETHNIDECTD
jgi:hypothetical protein